MSVETKHYDDVKKYLDTDLTEKIEELVKTKNRYLMSILDDLHRHGEDELAKQLTNQVKGMSRTSPTRISIHTKNELNKLKQKKYDGTLESYDEVIKRLLNEKGE